MDAFLSRSPAETMDVAGSFAATLQRNSVVALVGDLGSGKTQFVKGVCRHFRVKDPVASPTFVMLHRYAGIDGNGDELFVYHFDLYKMRVPSEILELGYEEYFRGNGICLIEWADKLNEFTPRVRTEVRFTPGRTEN